MGMVIAALAPFEKLSTKFILDPMNTPENALACFCKDLLEDGVPISEESLRGLAATLGDCDHGVLAGRLGDVDDAEAQPMRELLLFPDEPLARAVEGWIMERGFTAPFDHRKVADGLRGVRVNFVFPDGASFSLKLDAADAQQFVARLHAHSPLPGALTAALEQAGLEHEAAVAVRVRCRRARFAWDEARAQFVARLVTGLQRLRTDAQHLVQVVSWVLEFCSSAPEDIPLALARKRDDLLRQMRQAQELEDARAKYNFETRRMLGMVEPHLDAGALQRELALLEAAAMAIGGLPLASQSLLVERDLGDCADVEAMQRALGLFDLP